MRTILAVFLLLVAGQVALAQPPRQGRQAEAACRLPDGWGAIEQRKPRYVVFGEVHGTAQSPAFVGQVACALAASGKSVLLGIEFDAALDPQFQDAWAKPHARFAEDLVKAGWAGRSDGVASQGMLAMLVRLHALKENGARIAIVAFNGARNAEQASRFADLPGQGPHEAEQAENIAVASRAQAHDVTLVLVGNFHARRQPIALRGVTYDPMAARLAATGPLVSLNMQSAGGTAWNCQLRPESRARPGQAIRKEDVACADWPVLADVDAKAPPSIVLDAELDAAYDGAFRVGQVNGSPPAVPR